MFPKIDYQFYTEVYGGSLVEENEFRQYSGKALQFINELSASRLLVWTLNEDDEKLVKMAACALIDYDKENDERLAEVKVSSESVNNHSRTYNTSAKSKTNVEVYKEKVQIAYGYLLPTNLLYRGV